jgi:hypothetical protein
MRADARRRMDSVRKANGDTTTERGRGDRPPRGRRQAGDRDQRDTYYGVRDAGFSGFRLDQHGEIPLPPGSTLLSMNSLADRDELFYTLKLADGTVHSYIYNVKKATNAPFNTATIVSR